jgi:hypothetical protein
VALWPAGNVLPLVETNLKYAGGVFQYSGGVFQYCDTTIASGSTLTLLSHVDSSVEDVARIGGPDERFGSVLVSHETVDSDLETVDGGKDTPLQPKPGEASRRSPPRRCARMPRSE